VRRRVARSRELVAVGYRPAVVARAAGISRQALYRTPKPKRSPQRRPPRGPIEEAIVAKANPTDGYRMVWALTRRKLGVAVNRKRVLRVMREQGLIQQRGRPPRRRRPGFFRVERPGQLWHMDMSSVWVAEQGWCYLNAIIDCCTREIVGWSLDLRCRAQEAIAVLETAIARSGFVPDELQVGEQAERLTLGTDNGSAFTSRAFRARLLDQGVRHRRGGYRDPESQAFIESWFSKLKEREVWLNEYETLDDARRGIGGYVDRYHHRTAGSTTGRPSRCVKPGRIYKNKPPKLSTPKGSRPRPLQSGRRRDWRLVAHWLRFSTAHLCNSSRRPGRPTTSRQAASRWAAGCSA
jgi:putative transposase